MVFWRPTSSTSWWIGDIWWHPEGCGTPVALVTEVLSAKAVQWGLSKTLFDRLSEKQLPMLLDTQLLCWLQRSSAKCIEFAKQLLLAARPLYQSLMGDCHGRPFSDFGVWCHVLHPAVEVPDASEAVCFSSSCLLWKSTEDFRSHSPAGCPGISRQPRWKDGNSVPRVEHN